MFRLCEDPSYLGEPVLPVRLLQQVGGFSFFVFCGILNPDSWTLSFVPFPPVRCDALGAFLFDSNRKRFLPVLGKADRRQRDDVPVFL